MHFIYFALFAARRRIAELMSAFGASHGHLTPRRNKFHRSWKIITESLSSIPPRKLDVLTTVFEWHFYFSSLYRFYGATSDTFTWNEHRHTTSLIQAQGSALFMAWFWYEKLIKLMFLLRTRLLFSSGC